MPDEGGGPSRPRGERASEQLLDGDQVIRNTIDEAVLADSVGIDSFNIGEHYRPEFMDSAGHVILAAIAGRTAAIAGRTERI